MTTQAPTTAETFYHACRRDDVAWFKKNPRKPFRYRRMSHEEFVWFMTAAAADCGSLAPQFQPTRRGWLLVSCLAFVVCSDGTSGKGPLYFGVPDPKALRAAAMSDPMVGWRWLLPLVAAGEPGATEIMQLMVFTEAQIPRSLRFEQLCRDAGVSLAIPPIGRSAP